MHRWILLICLGVLPQLAAAEWLTNFDQAQEKAQKEDRAILLYFAGSDWCAPCIKLKKEIFETETFQSFAKDNLVLLMADFPRRKANRLPADQEKHNEALAEKYNNMGTFPMTVLINGEGKTLAKWEGYQSTEPASFITEVRTHLPDNSTGAVESGALKSYQETLLLMGSRFVITVVGDEEAVARQNIAIAIAEIRRIENLISSWREGSETTRINKNAGIAPVKVSSEVFELIKRSKMVSDLTQGAFDISFGSIDDRFWHFDVDMTELPDSSVARKSVRLIDYQNIVLDEKNSTVFLRNKGMKIGFGAIGKGYAAQKVKTILKKRGVKSGIINAGGDLAVWGNQPDGQPWTIAIANPNMKDRAFSWMEIKDMAVVTSGNYEKYATVNGKKYSHIIDPKSGFPVSGVKSVTIISPNAELADALATAVFILGQEVGMNMVDQMKGVECILIDDKDQLFTSKNLQLNAEK